MFLFNDILVDTQNSESICWKELQMINKTIEMIFDILGNIENVTVVKDNLNVSLTDMGVDSISFIKLIVALEEKFECEIPDEKLLITEMNTVQKINDILCSLNK